MREISAFAAALLLAAGLAAAVSAVTVRVSPEKAPRIAVVRLADLTADYVTRSLREGGDSKKALIAARAWAVRLEEALVRVARHHGVVLLTAGAVAAGAVDLTREVEAAMATNTPLNKEKKNDDNRRR